ncbi:hypothetical protein ACSBR1_038095 [Camellia fascicularis]
MVFFIAASQQQPKISHGRIVAIVVKSVVVISRLIIFYLAMIKRRRVMQFLGILLVHFLE